MNVSLRFGASCRVLVLLSCGGLVANLRFSRSAAAAAPLVLEKIINSEGKQECYPTGQQYPIGPNGFPTVFLYY